LKEDNRSFKCRMIFQTFLCFVLGMLLFVVVYILWKARSRLCRSSRFSPGGIGNARLSATKFDLDYWLKQVDLLDAKEVERTRENLSPYLELPMEEPRDTQAATASWTVDTWRHWRLVQYRQQHQPFQQRSNEQIESDTIPYRRRRFLFRRFIRRLLTPSHQRPSYLIEHSPSLIADLRPSIVNNNLIPPPDTLNVQPRRVASWPRLKSTHHQTGTMLSALQTQFARKRLLKRTSRTTFDI
jgi:hypothetical protein